MNSKSNRITSALTITSLYSTVTAVKILPWVVFVGWKHPMRLWRPATSFIWYLSRIRPFNDVVFKPLTQPVIYSKSCSLDEKIRSTLWNLVWNSLRRPFTGVDRCQTLLFPRQVRRSQLWKQGRLWLGYRSTTRKECSLDFPHFWAGRRARMRLRFNWSLSRIRRLGAIQWSLLRKQGTDTFPL